MGILEEKCIEPRRVFHFFEELCSIPHGSGNVRQISDHLAEFARIRGLEYTQDQAKNIVIRAAATPGYENRDTVILQGHMDMVAVKDDGVEIDLEKDGLDLATDGQDIWAKGTSLGGDDGIAVAYCMAILDSDDIPHPPLEVVITTDEETGMCGAKALDASLLKGRRLINIDNEEEGVLLVSCAGGARFNISLPVKRTSPKNGAKRYVLSVEGLRGGHSGETIKDGTANACVIIGRLLRELSMAQGATVELVSLAGGEADNAIARSAKAQLYVSGNTEGLIDLFGRLSEDIRGEYRKKDPDMRLSLVQEGPAGEDSESVMDVASLRNLSQFISVMPYGVQAMSAEIEGLVETSLNLGLLSIGENDSSVSFGYSVRSSVRSAKDELLSKLEIITERFEGAYSITGTYPEWPYRQNSPLRDTMVRVYEEQFGVRPGIQAIHAGVECGIFSEKLGDLDCVSIGPDMRGIHTTSERLSISSAAHTWEYLKAVLAAL